MMHFHTKNIEETLLTLESNPSGLSNEEVSKRQEEYGLNILPSKPDMTLFAHFLQQFKSPII
jgi:Ca2+-transporting ATPase